MNDKYKRLLFFLMFASSGFTGLIYESIWTQYIKLFLGHAAFAQALVLSIFMLGLAIGSWFAAKWSYRFSNPFIIYAIIELVIGIFGIIFHGLYIQLTEFSYQSIFPALDSSVSVQIIQWFLAALLILPQSILLGMTFPIMSAGFIRRDSATAGKDISILYFSNSLGAVAGVLISGYVLINHLGLPGTVLFAGFINCILALVVYLFARKLSVPKIGQNNNSEIKVNNLFGYMLFVALFTGVASFLYEVAWIRMLTQVLGASTHAFELMLSAFIFGLAIGSFWIKKRINTISNPRKYLGVVQILMGSAALITIIAYNQLFDLMQYGFQIFTLSEQGYTLFNLLSQFIALLIMLPATIFAGMTLPLLTHILITENYGEKSVGLVYAANTIGAIIGIIIAVSIGFILFGSKGIIILGASIDVIVGFLIIKSSFNLVYSKKLITVCGLFVTSFILIISTVNFDQKKINSAVYRTGFASLPKSSQIFLYQEGRTASVSITGSKNTRIIRTNGKPDAAINLTYTGLASGDEPTMVLCGILGLLYNPQAKNVANIGMGSGLTSETILSFPQIEKLHTIEIESLMVEAAKFFAPIVTKPYTDPRNEFIIKDAKSHFASTKDKYDIIFSEPSNPWVSGISGLFTKEFYKVAKENLTENGLLIQWLHIYETNEKLVASVIKALSSVMSDYVIYTTNGVDIIIVSKKSNKLGQLPDDRFKNIFRHPGIKKLLNKLGYDSNTNISILKIGEKAYLDPYFKSIDVPQNSDFFPYIDQNAVKARYLRSHAGHFTDNILTSLPYVEILDNKYHQTQIKASSTVSDIFWIGNRIKYSNELLNIMSSDDIKLIKHANTEFTAHAILVNLAKNQCRMDSSYFINSLKKIILYIIPFVDQDKLELFWEKFQQSKCFKNLNSDHLTWVKLLRSQSNRDTKTMYAISTQLLATEYNDTGYLLAANMLSGIAENRYSEVILTWDKYQGTVKLTNQYYSLIKIFYMLASNHLNQAID